jgi:hypothetical protein
MENANYAKNLFLHSKNSPKKQIIQQFKYCASLSRPTSWLD